MRVRIRLDPAASVPLWEQLRAGLESRIRAGRLPPGRRLPTVRAMAEDLGLAPNTVAKAYRALEGSGLLVGRGRRGTFVTDRLHEAPTDLERRLGEAAAAFLSRTRQLGLPDEDAIGAVRRAIR